MSAKLEHGFSNLFAHPVCFHLIHERGNAFLRHHLYNDTEEFKKIASRVFGNKSAL
jgi:hypothetical protein